MAAPEVISQEEADRQLAEALGEPPPITVEEANRQLLNEERQRRCRTPARKPRYINPPDPPLDPPPSKVLKAIDKLGMPKEKWDRAKLMAALEFGRYMSVKVMSRISMSTTFETLEQVNIALNIGVSLAKNEAIAAETRLTAVNIVSNAAAAHCKLTDKLLDLAEKSQEKTTQDRPRNLPPQVALQVNVGGPNPSPGPPTPAISETRPVRNLPPA